MHTYTHTYIHICPSSVLNENDRSSQKSGQAAIDQCSKNNVSRQGVGFSWLDLFEKTFEIIEGLLEGLVLLMSRTAPQPQ
jgi:hypothetical protein